ncbi:serine O-acetyltransferase [Thiothrix eikelboomii]|uniref:Serine acetyltransferase n=2 Tax=Thiothrix eikelboomii TaxID=92487 RepID=A0A1T4XJ25_9GAMM|nr:serine O-acetyltransferase [Thiothrix eikelboomii]
MGHHYEAKAWLKDPVVRFIAILRIYEFLINTNKPRMVQLLTAFFFKRTSIKLGFSVGPNVFGPGVAIVHYGLLIIDPTTRIGKNCRIHMGVHIGGAAQFVEAGTEADFSPRIGDNVYIGPGAKIYGPVTIGNNCTIGANAVVTKSFDGEGLTLAGVPAKIINQSPLGSINSRILRGAK